MRKRSRSAVVLAIGLGTLLALTILPEAGAMLRARKLYIEGLVMHETFLASDTLLRELPGDLHLTGIYVRDFLLDPSPENSAHYRTELEQLLAQIAERLEQLGKRVEPRQRETLDRLTSEMQAYSRTLDPLFDWSPQQRGALSRTFLREVILPRRQAVVQLAEQLSQLNSEALAAERVRLDRSQEQLQQFLRTMMIVAALLGTLVSLAILYNLTSLERVSDAQRQRAEGAERELRLLSRRLVQAQEEERKELSRELHDALGQKLSFIGMELGTLSTLRLAEPRVFEARLNDAQRQITEMVRTVRDLSMALRPAMLDELGLGSAVRWQGREFAKRSGIDVDVQLDGELDDLPETVRTAVYRIVQEALTNCLRHARAREVRISLYGGQGTVRLVVQDDGQGFDDQRPPRRGLGLIGMEERARGLGGTLSIRSRPQRGTILEMALPVARGEAQPA